MPTVFQFYLQHCATDVFKVSAHSYKLLKPNDQSLSS